jgi:hypothetical protein
VCGCRKQLRMKDWLEHLLYFAADASARKDWVQATKALDAFSACLKHGAPLSVRPLPWARHSRIIVPLQKEQRLEVPDASSGHHVACMFPMQAEMAGARLLPLLDRLAGEPNELLRRSLLTAISIMAQAASSGDPMPTPVREDWAEKVSLPPLLLLYDSLSPRFESHSDCTLSFSCTCQEPYKLLWHTPIQRNRPLSVLLCFDCPWGRTAM